MGQGYVGLPVAMRAADVGYRVVGIDSDPTRVARLRAGDSFVEDVPARELNAALGSGRYTITDSYAEASGFAFAVITVPTPLREGTPDLSYVESAARSIAPHLTPGACVILESTTYPGTTETLVMPLLEQGSGMRCGVDFHLGYSPERIDPGNVAWHLVNTPKVVSGVTAASLQAVQGFYDTLIDKTVPVRGTREAELTKLLENTYRHVNIALVNELAIYAHQLGIDLPEVIDAATTKPFGFQRFTPGPGVGGHCLPIDPSYLSWQVKRSLGRSFRFIELANDINSYMPVYVVQRLTGALNRAGLSINGATVVLVGLAYKPNSADCRESPALRVAEELHRMGAELVAIDPHVEPARVPPYVRLAPLDEALVDAADAVVILTDHDAIDYELISGARLIFDTRSRVFTGAVEHL